MSLADGRLDAETLRRYDAAWDRLIASMKAPSTDDSRRGLAAVAALVAPVQIAPPVPPTTGDTP